MTFHLQSVARARFQQHPMPRFGHRILNHCIRKSFNTIGDSVSHASISDAVTVWLREQSQNTLTQLREPIRQVA